MFEIELFKESNGRRIVITHGFVKKTQKTPAKEIIKAMKYRKEWQERRNHGLQ